MGAPLGGCIARPGADASARRTLDRLKPLDPARADAIQKGLAALTGRTVLLGTKIDPSVLGGLVARIGSTVYDGSVVRQLEKMKERLVESV